MLRGGAPPSLLWVGVPSRALRQPRSRLVDNRTKIQETKSWKEGRGSQHSLWAFLQDQLRSKDEVLPIQTPHSEPWLPKHRNVAEESPATRYCPALTQQVCRLLPGGRTFTVASCSPSLNAPIPNLPTLPAAAPPRVSLHSFLSGP